MRSLRKYGSPPYKVAVLHGGPGGAGQAAPIARKLATRRCGVLEPLQTKTSIAEQIQELYDTIRVNVKDPITIIGHSWGAMLAILFAAKHPSLVKKLIIISCGPLEKKYVHMIMKNRERRMTKEEKRKMEAVFTRCEDPKYPNKGELFLVMARLSQIADSYDLIRHKEEIIEASYEIFNGVWHDVVNKRNAGMFIEAVKKINCPVVAIHGDKDPHPAIAVKERLSSSVKDFQFILLKKCGHYPWLERHAKEQFYKILNLELRLC